MAEREAPSTSFIEGAVGNPGGWTEERLRKIPFYKEEILKGLAAGLFISEICQSLDIRPKTVREWRSRDPDFSEMYVDSEAAVTDQLEKEAVRRAKDGILEPVVSKGQLVLDEKGEPLMMRRYSDSLMAFLLKGRRRDVYGDVVKTDNTHKIDVEGARDELRRKLSSVAGR